MSLPTSDEPTSDETDHRRPLDQPVALARANVVVKAAAPLLGGFGLVTLALGVAYGDGRWLLMSAILFFNCASLLLLWRYAVRQLAKIDEARAGQAMAAAATEALAAERVRLEDELREAQKLDAVGRLAGGVAHDFNNQLTSILGYTELLVWSFDESDPRRQDVEEIRKAADRAALVTQQLLAFSRRQILQPRLVHVPDVLMRSVRLLHRVLPSHITVDTAIDPDLAPVFVDPHQLGHVVLNLAVSARDMMPDGGTLSVRASNVPGPVEPSAPPHAVEARGWVRLVVHDTGTAIPAERLPYVFEPFANQTHTSPGSLELAVVHGIVTQSGGRIRVQSEAGRGTTFTIEMPAAAEALDDAPGHAQPVGGHETILLVEDDAAVRTLLASTLERQGYGVTAAPGADEAMGSTPQSVHALIVDLGLADGRGEHVATDLAARFPGLPIVYIAGRPETACADTTRPGGRLLQKPFTPRDLLVALRETLDQRRPEIAKRFPASHV